MVLSTPGRPTSDDGFTPDDQQMPAPDPYGSDEFPPSDNAPNRPRYAMQKINIDDFKKSLDPKSLPKPITAFLEWPMVLIGRPPTYESAIVNHSLAWLLTTRLAMQRPLSKEETQRVAYYSAWGVARIHESSDIGLFVGSYLAVRRGGGSGLARGGRILVGSTLGYLAGRFLSPLLVLPMVTYRQEKDPVLVDIFKRFHHMSRNQSKELEECRQEAFRLLYPRTEVRKVQAHQLPSPSTVAEEQGGLRSDEQSPQYRDGWDVPSVTSTAKEPATAWNAPASVSSTAKEPASAWEKLRQQNQPTPQPAGRMSRSGRIDGATGNGGDTSQQESRSEAQKDFDARLDRERQGQDFDDASNKKWR
jgi:hypothetical protein